MFPELFQIGPLPIRSYGLMLAAAFVGGIAYVRWITNRQGKPFEPYLALSYVLIFGGVVGARIFYVVTHLEEFQYNWWATIDPFHGSQFGIAGLTLYGGILLAVVGAFVYCRIAKMPVLEVFDIFAPPLALGIAFGRMGCFLNGCCFGSPTDLPWGISFPEGSIPFSYFGSAHLHPAQLYSLAYALALFISLHFLLKHKQFNGQVVSVYFIGEAIFRFIIEYTRHYESDMLVSFGGIELINNQLVSLGLFALGLVIYLMQMRKGRFTD